MFSENEIFFFFGSKTKCSVAAAEVGGGGVNAVVKVHEVES